MPLVKPIVEIVENYDRYLGEDGLDTGDFTGEEDPVPEGMLRAGLRPAGKPREPLEGFVRAHVPDQA